MTYTPIRMQVPGQTGEKVVDFGQGKGLAVNTQFRTARKPVRLTRGDR